MACRYEREGYGGSYGREPANYGRYYMIVEHVCAKVLSCISALLLLSGFDQHQHFNLLSAAKLQIIVCRSTSTMLHTISMYSPSCGNELCTCREGYPPERGYGGPAYGEPGYERGAYGSGYGSAAYDRGYDDRGYGGREAYSSRGAAPAREGAYSRPGSERDYARSAARAPGPYERPASSLPPR